MTHHLCTAALFRANCNPHCSVLLCKTNLTAGSVSLQLHLCRFALHTGVHLPSTNALQHCLRQNAIPTAQCCSAKQAHSRQCVTAVTPMEVCISYRCAVTQHQCTAALFRAKCNPHCSVLLCKTESQQCCVSAVTPVEICSSYRCAVTQHQCTAALFKAKCNPHCSVLLCKTVSQHACVTAVTPMGICSSYRCALTHHLCTVLQSANEHIQSSVGNLPHSSKLN